MAQAWGPDKAGPAHETWTTTSHHWRGGARYYAQCRCGWKGREWANRFAAEAEGEKHTDKATITDRQAG